MLPRDFLAQIARDHELSPEQEAVFLLRFADGKSYKEIGTQLKTSADACLKRMGQVYQKFHVQGGVRGKENRLRIFLLNRLRQLQHQAERESGESSTQASPAILPREPISVPLSRQSLIPPSLSTFPPTPPAETCLYQNLPRREYTTFVGRQEEMKRLLQLISINHASPWVSIDGIGGVGKTTLALEAAYRCLEASQYPQGITEVPTFGAIIFTSAKQQYLTPFYLLQRLKSQRTLRDIFWEIAHTLKQPEITHSAWEDQLDLIRESLAKQRTLLIVDNLETVEDQEAILAFLYDLPPTVKVILTTREQALFVPIRLGSLSLSEGLRLIHHEAQEKQVSITDNEARLLYERTSGVAGALIYAIGLVAAGYHSITDVLAKIAEPSGDVARFCFDASVSPLRGSAAHQLLMSLTLFTPSATEEALAQVGLAVPEPRLVADSLARLQQLSLVTYWQGRYNMMALTHEYARAELAANPTFEQDIRDRWVSWYLHLTEELKDLDWKEWCPEHRPIQAEWENLRAVIDFCIAKGRYTDVQTFWGYLKGYTHVRGYWDDRLEWTGWLKVAADEQRDWGTLVEVMSDRGRTLTQMGQPAQLEEAESLFSQAWELRSHVSLNFQLELATNIVILCIRRQQIEQANHWLSVERKLLEQVNLSPLESQRQLVHILYYQAQISYRAGDLIQAKRLFEQALAQAEQIRWQRTITVIQNWLAAIAVKQENYGLARQLLMESYPIAQRYQDKRSIAFHQQTFAQLEKLSGNLAAAKRWADEAAHGFESLKMVSEAREMRSLLV